MRVLTLIDKDQDFERFSKRLALSGYHVVQASDEEEAWEYLQREQVQSVVLDCESAQIAFIEKLRNANAEEYIYVFALVDVENPDWCNDDLLSIADEYIQKPVEPDELIARLVVVDRYIKTLSAIRSKKEKPEPIRDAITGTFTQSTILELLATEISRSKRSGKPFALALLMVDGLSHLQEQHEPYIIEKALSQVALKIWASVRAYDLIGRWGETGFMLVLPETSLAGASVVADRIRKNVNGVPFHLPDMSQVQLSASMGFVQNGQQESPPMGDLIIAAENALSRAIEGGGNHIVFSWEKS